MESIENTARMSRCPSFDGCSSPLCPLDSFQDDRINFPEDSVCSATKRTRFLIGQDMDNLGMTKAELRGYFLSYGSVNATKEALKTKFHIGKKIEISQGIVKHSPTEIKFFPIGEGL